MSFFMSIVGLPGATRTRWYCCAAPAHTHAQLVEALVADMAEEGIEGRNITLKLKLSTFEVSRQQCSCS